MLTPLAQNNRAVLPSQSAIVVKHSEKRRRFEIAHKSRLCYKTSLTFLALLLPEGVC